MPISSRGHFQCLHLVLWNSIKIIIICLRGLIKELISQYSLGQWLGIVEHQAIALTNIDKLLTTWNGTTVPQWFHLASCPWGLRICHLSRQSLHIHPRLDQDGYVVLLFQKEKDDSKKGGLSTRAWIILIVVAIVVSASDCVGTVHPIKYVQYTPSNMYNIYH